VKTSVGFFIAEMGEFKFNLSFKSLDAASSNQLQDQYDHSDDEQNVNYVADRCRCEPQSP
jgi:hypothetical protein